MTKFAEIKCLSEKEQEKIEHEIQQAIQRKIAQKLITEKEIREIQEMKLDPLLDIQDVQSVYEDFLYREKKK